MRYIRNSVNIGVSASRNIGIGMSRGTFVTFLDSDDIYYPDKVEKQVRALERTNAGFICCFYSTTTNVCDVEDRAVYWWQSMQPLYPGFLHPQNTWIVTPGVMIRRDILEQSGKFDENMKICEDLDLWSRILQVTQGIVLQEVLVCIYLRQNEKLRYFENILARHSLYTRLFARDKSLDENFKKLLYSALIDQYLKCARNHSEPKSLINKLNILRDLSVGPLDILTNELPSLVARWQASDEHHGTGQ